MSKQKKIVAVVDDDPEMRAAMARLLSSFGYSAETFDSAETFLICASTSKAICLVVDIELGDISGVELAHKLAARFKFLSVPKTPSTVLARQQGQRAQSRTVSAETASLSPAKGLGAAQAILATLAFSSSIKTRLFSE
jgi:DNA-binding NtrC family response regulator